MIRALLVIVISCVAIGAQSGTGAASSTRIIRFETDYISPSGVLCPSCRSEKQRSQVRRQHGAFPLAAIAIHRTCFDDDFWDEDGEKHHHDQCSEPPAPKSFMCSRGHAFQETVTWTIPECWCGWSRFGYRKQPSKGEPNAPAK